MPSPFPGMDPFIEAYGLWEDFHSHLIEGVYDALAAQAPERYVVRTGERTYVVLSEGLEEPRLFKPDIAVTDLGGPGTATATSVAEVTTAMAPVVMHAFLKEEIRETFVEIRDAEREGAIVACIEALSPTNKRRGADGREYLDKRRAFLSGVANFVEIDLLRGGHRMPMVEPWPASPYYVLVARRESAPACRVWRANSVQPLPHIPVPLLPSDGDLTLDLQPIVDRIYARSRYSRSINYADARGLKLQEDEQELVRQFSQKS
ncbi:MAG: DUF4058 family protein [Gemmataceae bacterium]